MIAILHPTAMIHCVKVSGTAPKNPAMNGIRVGISMNIMPTRNAIFSNLLSNGFLLNSEWFDLVLYEWNSCINARVMNAIVTPIS